MKTIKVMRAGRSATKEELTCAVEGQPLPPVTTYVHPKTIDEFEAVYRKEYEQELESCDRWIEWCKKQDDYYGVNFHQGMRSAHVFNEIKMCQLIRVLKREPPNA